MKFLKFAPIILMAVCLAGCSDQLAKETSDIVEGFIDGWDDIDKIIDENAEEYCNIMEDDPSLLLKSSSADYIPAFDNFTLTLTIDRKARATSTMFFGELGEFASEMDNINRENKTKKDATILIKENFNDSWAALFVSLCYLDGTFSLAYETDFIDNDFEYDATEMLNILETQDYLEGDWVEITDQE